MRIAIIKLGAKGDVIRTLAILPGLKKKFPHSEIYWITKENVASLIEGNKQIRKVLTIPCKVKEKFDAIYNFDIEKEATSLAIEVGAEKKFGFYLEDRYPVAFNLGAEYYLNTLFDDELKKSNRKTYQEVIFEAAELKYHKEFCGIELTTNDKKYGEEFLEKNNLRGKRLIGIHIGASPRWPSKVWHEHELIKFVKKAKEREFEVLLFGGPNESEQHKKIANELEKEKIRIFKNNPSNTDREFASLINICEKIICSDSFALHISLALRKKTVGLFFCTSPYEVEDYGLLKKLVSPMLEEFFPERMDQYNEELTKSISAEEVLKEIEK